MSRAAPAIVAVCGAAALALGLWVGSRGPGYSGPGPASAAGYVLDARRTPQDFSLVDGSGAPFGPADLQGQWSFMYFGFTFCPDVCPAALTVMAATRATLQRRDPDLEASWFLVSVDPRRDTPQRVADYVDYFDPAFRGLTGAPEEIDKLASAAGVVYRVPDAPPDTSYLVDHSSTITLVNPRGEIHAIFTPPFVAARLAEDFGRIRAAWPAGG